MAYTSDNTAIDMRAVQTAWQEQLPSQRRLTVVETGRRASRALSPLAVTLLRCAVASVAVLVVASFVKIALIAVTFGYTTANAGLNDSLDDARSVACDLEIQLADLSSRDRVWANATQAHGMVAAEQAVVLDVLAAGAAPVAGGESE